MAPRFEVDPMWPKPLPNHWIYGNVIGVGVDTQATTSTSSTAATASLERRKEIYAALNPPASECCVAGAAGARVRPGRQSGEGVGRPGPGLRVARRRTTASPSTPRATSGSAATARNDGHILKFTQRRQVHEAVRLRLRERRQQRHVGVRQGREDLVDEKANEAYVADGYGNKRVAVIDMDTGKIKRYWGAYGNKPDDTNLGRYNPDAPLAQQFRNPVHCAELSNDGFVYVCDRAERSHPGLHEGRQVREGSTSSRRRRSATARCGTSRSRRTRSRSTSIMADGANEKIYVFDRQSLEMLTSFGDGGRQPGAVLRRAQHRDRLEGQHLHDRNLRGQAPAEVRLQGPRAR